MSSEYRAKYAINQLNFNISNEYALNAQSWWSLQRPGNLSPQPPQFLDTITVYFLDLTSFFANTPVPEITRTL
jgi:hypothetical protein